MSPLAHRIGLDDEPLDPAWRTPRRGTGQWSGSLTFLAITAVLLLVLGGLWTGGAFARRDDRVEAYLPGQVLDAGPFTLTLDRAEVTWTPKTYRSNGAPIWVLVARGTASSTIDEPVLLDDAGMVVESERRFRGKVAFGGSDPVSTLQPGLVGVPVTITIELPANWTPLSPVQVGMRRQEYRQQQVGLGDSRRSWGSGSTVLTWWCPLTRMPDAS